MPNKNTPFHPIIYVRGYAMTPNEIDETTADPFCGFNLGSEGKEGNGVRPAELHKDVVAEHRRVRRAGAKASPGWQPDGLAWKGEKGSGLQCA